MIAIAPIRLAEPRIKLASISPVSPRTMPNKTSQMVLGMDVFWNNTFPMKPNRMVKPIMVMTSSVTIT